MSFAANDGNESSKVTQGDIRNAPPRGLDVASAGIFGRGCKMWDAICKARFPPAESPPRMRFAGAVPLETR